MLVYRVENAGGEGPYVSGAANVLREHNYCANHPIIYEDNIDLYRGVDPRCGCVSLEALKKWFGEYLQTLLNLGYYIVEYSVLDSRVIVGKSGIQCGFDRYYASK